MIKYRRGSADFIIDGEVLCSISDVYGGGPIDLLKAFVEYFNKRNEGGEPNNTQSVNFYVESNKDCVFTISNMMDGGPHMFLIWYEIIHEEEGEWRMKACKINPREVAEELIVDIESDMDNWSEWGAFDIPGLNMEKKSRDQKKELTELVKNLRVLIGE